MGFSICFPLDRISFSPISNRNNLGAILNSGKLSKASEARQQEAPGVPFGAGSSARPTLIQSQTDSRVASSLPDGYCSCQDQTTHP